MDARNAEKVRWEVVIYGLKPGDKKTAKELRELLQQGWEPFAVTWDGGVWDYHLRRHSDGSGA